MIEFIGFCCLNFIVGGAGAWGAMKYGSRLGVHEIPNHRSSHVKTTPRCGGIGILMAFVISSLMLPIPIYFWLPAMIISLISFWGGDKHRLSAKERLVFQFICSGLFLVFVGNFMGFPVNSIFMILPLSIFVVGTSNFYNFMDGIDGIAGITGIVAFSLLAIYSYVNNVDGSYTILSVTLVFSCIGFLVFNFPKAKVFLGDVGSVLLGFLFACIVIVLSKTVADFLAMAGFLATFYFDEIFTMIMRVYNNESLLQPHRKHIYQLLVNELSISHWKIALLYGVVQFFIGLTIIYCRFEKLYALPMLYIFYILLFIFLSMKVLRMAAVK